MAPPDFPPMPSERFFRHALLRDVIDGDTLDVVIDLGWSMDLRERLRLALVNTPEKRGEEREAGLWVKAQVEALLPIDTPLIIASTAYSRTGRVRGKFGRTVALVYHAEEKWCLNQRLLERQIAWQTDKNGSLIGDRSMDVLTGIPNAIRNPGSELSSSS